MKNSGVYQSYDPEDPADRPPRTSARGMVLFGFSVLALGAGVVGGWAAFAPLATGSVAPGFVKIEGDRKIVQHLEGGIVRTIHVKEGSAVAEGDLLITLDDTQARAKFTILNNENRRLLATVARLEAERNGADEIVFPEELVAAINEPGMAKLLIEQREIFKARRETIYGTVEILNRRTAQAREEISGLQRLISSRNQQRNLIEEELAGVRTLFNQGYAPKTRLLALERAAEGIKGENAQRSAEIASVRQRIGELEIRVIEEREKIQREAAGGLEDASARLADLRQEITAVTDLLNRREIRAPKAGIVLGLRVHTSGAVIGSGTDILEIVPTDGARVIEAHISTEDIDVVHAGLPARVSLTAYDSRRTPDLPAVVTQVSADRIVDQRTGRAYFIAKVEMDQAELTSRGLTLAPGMSADVIIITGERTIMDYILSPLTSNMRRSLRES